MKNSIITTIIATPFAIALIGLLVIQQAWAISVLWGWFLVPLGLPAIGIATAIGISAILSALHQSRKSPGDEGWKSVGKAALKPWFLLAIGWIAKQFL
jgi:hypothetical protein